MNPSRIHIFSGGPGGARRASVPRSPSLSRRRQRGSSSWRIAASPSTEEKLAAAAANAAAANVPPTPQTTTPSSSSSGVLALAGVSLLWGTYAPSLRYLFLFDEALTPATLTAWRTALSAAAMLAAATATGALSDPAPPRATAEAASSSSSSSPSSSSAGAPPSPLTSSWVRAGAEIGLYNFLGTACQVTGVHATTATKAAFLGQATTALTPALAALGGLKVTGLQWAACAAAVAGSALIAGDEVASSSSAAEEAASSLAGATAAAVTATTAAANANAANAPTLSGGEPFVLLACVFYALSTVRMAVHAPRHGAARIATAKTAALAALSLVWAAGAAAVGGGGGAEGAGGGGGGGSSLLSFLALPPALAGSFVALAALTFSALGPGALATWLQASGQRSVPAAEAQVIFSLTPVWTALLSAGAAAVGVAGASAAESAMGTGAWAGSALVLAASVAVALEGLRGGAEGGGGGGGGEVLLDERRRWE